MRRGPLGGPEGPSRPGSQRVGIGRFETLLRRLLSVKGTVAPDVFPAIQPGIDVEGGPVENHFLRGEMLAMGHDEPAPLAARFCQVSLFPEVPRSIYVIEYLWIRTGALTPVRINIDAALSGTGPGTGHRAPRDSRWSPSQPTIDVRAGTAAAVEIVTNYIEYVVDTTLPLTVTGPWVLRDQSLNIEVETANTGIRVVAFWRERPLEASE